MDKVTAFLEKYVEWIAIGIAGLIFMWALWSYWISPDVTAQVGENTVGPRTVDAAVLRGPGASLEAAIERPGGIVIPVPNLLERLRQEVALSQHEARPLAIVSVHAGPSPIPPPSGELPGRFRVDEVPTPPPAHVSRLASGRSLADVPEGQQVSSIDLAEVRVDFQIPAREIAAAFREVRLPVANQVSSVLRVRLQRQRLLGDGTWGQTEEVQLLRNNPLLNRPMPQENVPADEKAAYASFAEQNQDWVLRPPFYEVRAGDDPGALPTIVEVGGAEAQPAAAQEDGQGQQDPGDRDAAPPPNGDNGGQINFGAQGDPRDPTGGGQQDDGRSRPPAGGVPPQGRPQPNTGSPSSAQPPAAGGAQQPARPGQPQGQPATQGAAGQFNAAQLRGAISGWAWDADAVPGETYRYRVIYALKNPMFQVSGVAADRNLESILAAFSSEQRTPWSPRITVEPLFYFYMTGSSDGKQAKFTIFRWQNGVWQSRDFDVTPGDPVGLRDQGGVDYRTGRTLVDVRPDPASKETYALLVDGEGRFSRATLRDMNDPRFRELQQQVRDGAGVAGR